MHTIIYSPRRVFLVFWSTSYFDSLYQILTLSPRENQLLLALLKFIRQFSSFLTTLKSFVLPLLLHKTVHALNHWFSSCTTLVARVHCKCIGLGCIITILSSVAIFDFLLPPRSKKCHKNLWKCRDFWL